ncbi:hypothetical protein KBC86_00545 [Candidatus Gracilibacteria bacterium]|nr:hypothetical protein [Candidatus Gracilibacteria bacterium]
MATATISAATLAFLSLIALIGWAVVYWKMKKEHHPLFYSKLKVRHLTLRAISLTLLGLSVATYFGLH